MWEHSLISCMLIGLGLCASDKVFCISPADDNQVEVLKKWINTSRIELDIWKPVSTVDRPVDIHAKANDADDVIRFLTEHDIAFSVMIDNLQNMVEEERMALRKNSYSNHFNYYKYNQYSNIRFELSNLARKHANLETFVVGKSYENQRMVGVKITDGSGLIKPAVWIDGGIHSREWISVAAVMLLIRRLVTSKDDATVLALKKYDFYILPVFNPDGYRYTFAGFKERTWRKTRSNNGLPQCAGADANRNWGFKWGESGASRNPCKDDYRGKTAFSEIEVRNVKDFLEDLVKKTTLKSFWNVHSYSQLVLTPWTYADVKPKDYDEIERVAKVFSKVVKERYGTMYQTGSPAKLLYPASGSSIDWTYGHLGILYSYSLELRDTGKHGFMLPENQIKPTGEETCDAILAAINEMK